MLCVVYIGWSSQWDVVAIIVGLLIGQVMFDLIGGLVESKYVLVLSSLLVVVGTLLAIIPGITNLFLGLSRMILGLGTAGCASIE